MLQTPSHFFATMECSLVETKSIKQKLKTTYIWVHTINYMLPFARELSAIYPTNVYSLQRKMYRQASVAES